VKAGESYLVGEKGVEQFVPDQPGTIIPNHKLGGGDERLTKVLEALSAQLAAGASGSTNIDASSVNMSSAPNTTIGQANSPRQRVAVYG
jgi:hypothetical protein